MALTAQQTLPLQLEKVAPNIADAVDTSGILAKFLGMGGQGAERVSLRSFRVRLLTALASNPQQIGLDTGSLPPGLGDRWDQMLLSPIAWCLGVQYSQLAQLTADGEGVATDNGVTKTISDIARQASRSRDIFLQTPGDGSLASVDSTSGANFINLRSATTTVIDGRRASLLNEQQTVQVMSPTYVLRGTCTISQVFKGLGQTQQIQVDGIPAGTIAGDLIVVGGASPGAPQFVNGIPVFVNTSTLGNLYGISRALPYVVANGVNLSNTAQVTKPIFRLAENQIVQRLGPEGLEDQFYHTHPSQLQAFEELAFGDTYVPLAGGKAGAYDPLFASFTINGRKILQNPHADQTRWDLLLKKAWGMVKWGPGQFWLKTRAGQMIFPVMDPSTGLPTVQEVMYWVDAKLPIGPSDSNVGMRTFLIDLEAEKPTGGKQAKAVQPERLNRRHPDAGDAIVRAHGKMNHERVAEMPTPVQFGRNNPESVVREQSDVAGRSARGESPARKLGSNVVTMQPRFLALAA